MIQPSKLAVILKFYSQKTLWKNKAKILKQSKWKASWRNSIWLIAFGTLYGIFLYLFTVEHNLLNALNVEANSDFYLKFYFFGIFVYKNGQKTSPLNPFSGLMMWPSSVAGFLSTKLIQSTKSVCLKLVHHCSWKMETFLLFRPLPPYFCNDEIFHLNSTFDFFNLWENISTSIISTSKYFNLSLIFLLWWNNISNY